MNSLGVGANRNLTEGSDLNRRRQFMSFRICNEWSETALRSLRSRLIERHVLPAFRDD